MSFKYTSRLGEHELRLLRPVSVTPFRLDFKIVTVSRSSATSYTALSYAWGTESSTEHIFLNGRPFPVRPNLWSCLFNLAGNECNMNLWVDAICINQEDNLEKSNQVKRMNDTYTRADHVAVWLGLPSICETYQSQCPDPATRKTCQVQRGDFDWWDNIEDLARRPYWNRYWVIQEMLLGRNILIWCGNHAILWNDFQDILCSHAGIVDQYTSTRRDWNSDDYPALSLIMGRHVDRFPENREPLGALLVQHRRSECKDPRDRVFALMGLVDPEEAVLLSRFFPDYSLSEHEVIVIALAHVTQAMTTLTMFESKDIGIHSEDIFEAFRVFDKEQRRKLQDKAASLDYIGSTSVDHIRSQLSRYDPMHLSAGDSTTAVDAEALLLAYEHLFLKPQKRQKWTCQIL